MRKVKEKINPIMNDSKNVKKIKVNSIDDDENVIKNFIFIVVFIALIIGIVYGLTEILKKDEEVQEEISAGSVNYDKVSVGIILNRPYEEYYVLVYDSDDSKAVLYSTILTKYMQNEKNDDYIKIYYCDLYNNLNKPYYNVNNDNKSNPNAETVEDFDFSDLTLLKIKNGKIVKYIEDYESIKAILNK